MPDAEQPSAERPTLRSGMGFAATSFAVNTVVGLASAVLTARLFGVEVIGEYALVTAPWLILIPLSSMAEQKALTRRLATVPPRSAEVYPLSLAVLVFSTALTIVIGLLVGIASTLVLRGPVDQPDLVVPALVVLAGYILVANTGWNLDATISAFRAGRELFVARLLQVASFPVFAVLLYPFDDSVWALTVATVASFVISVGYRVAILHRFLVWGRPRPAVRAGMRELRAFLGFGVRLLPGRMAAAVSGQSATWILGATTSMPTVGAYSRANTIAVRINESGYRVNEIMFPALVERWSDGGATAMVPLLRKGLQAVGLVLFGMTTVAAAVAPGVLDVFGEGFDRAATAFGLLLYGGSVYVCHTLQQQSLLAVGRPGLVSVVTVIRSVVTLGLLVPLAIEFEASGAAAAILVAEATTWLVQTATLSRVVGGEVAVHVASLAARAAASSIAGVAAGRLVYDALGSVVGVGAGAVVAAVGFVAVAFVTRWITDDELATVRQGVDQLRSRRDRRAVRTAT